MIGLGDLQSVKILTNLNDAMLGKIKSVTVVKKYKKNEYIFKEGDYAEHLYAIIAGKVALEVCISSGHTIRTKDISKDSAFGISSIADTENRTYIADARAIEDSTVFCWKSGDLEKLFYQDYKMGFLFMRNVSRILKKRLESNRAQLGKELNAAQYQIA